ncbi:MAG: 50S ribosomal protein L13 [bacterium]|nr:50S ribosomal protein L13 [bacterium]
MEHQIDATNQIFGRLASKVAVILRGKTRASFDPSVTPKEKVLVFNIKQLQFSGKKMSQKEYNHYSGYPGGIRTRYLEEEWVKNPSKIFKMTVYNMLPQNRLRDKIIKNLTVK